VSVPAALVIAAKDLRQRFRDRSALVLGFIAPLAIAGLMSLAFRGTETFHVTLDVVDRDRGPVASGLVDLLRSPALEDLVTVRTATDRAAATRDIRGGKAQAAIVVPAGFSAAATGGEPVPIAVLTRTDDSLAGDVTRSLVDTYVAQINADRLSVATALAAGARAEDLAAIAERAGRLRLPVEVVERPTGDRALKTISYYAPAMGIFFLFFAIGFGARGYFLEQRDGTLERMAAATGMGAILTGKALSVFVYGLASLGTMALATTLLFGADWGGFFPAAALCLAMVVSVVCLTAFVIVTARTERQAEGIASIVVFGLALLGGNFVFVSMTPPALRRLSLLTPNGWALRGFGDVSTGAHTLGTVLGPVAAILIFSAVVTAVTALLARRLVTA
jgi:ABC-2 type transport system permease protein